MKLFAYLLIFFSFVQWQLANAQDDQPETRTRTEPVPYYPPLEESKVVEEINKSTTNALPLSVGVGYSAATPSPEALRSNTLQNIPVNYFTGTPQINIPLASIGEGGLSTMLSLNYNPAMNRVHTVSGWTGLGWELSGIPTLSRIVRGFPDEGSLNNNNGQKGYYFYGYSINSSDYTQDKEPDIFILNLPEGSFRFMFDRYKKAHFFPEADIKVEVSSINNPNESGSNHYAKTFTEFKVISPNGTKYIFSYANKEESAEVEVKDAQNNGFYPYGSNFLTFLNNRLLTSAWYVSKIESPYGNQVNFTYNKVAYTYYKLAENKAEASCPTTVEKKLNKVYIRASQISSITTPHLKIKFNTGTETCSTDYSVSPPETVCTTAGATRYDIDSWANAPTSQSDSKLLLNIEVSDNEASPLRKKVFQFQYDYFDTSADATLPTGYVSADVGDSHKKKLKLESVTMPDASIYNFSYLAESEILQSRLSYGADHWGFANGITSNTKGLIGLGTLSSNSNCGSNRTPNFNFGKKAALNKITYSAGTELDLTYEANTANNYSSPIGGLRIKSIVTKNTIRSTEVKQEYSYVNGSQSSGFLSLKPIYRIYDNVNGIRSVAHSELFNSLNFESGRPIVGYDQVTENIVSNDLTIPSGKNIYYFDQDKTAGKILNNPNCLLLTNVPCYYNPIYFNLTDNDFRLGLPLKQESYNQSGSLLSVSESSFTPNGGIKYDSTYAFRSYRFDGSTGNYFWSSNSYYQRFRKHRIEETTAKTYSDDGTGTASSQTTFITYKDEMPQTYRDTYKGKHNMPVESSTTDAYGRTSVSRTKYIADFNFDSYTETVCDPGCNGDTHHFCPHPVCMVTNTVSTVPPAGYEARGIYEGYEIHLLSNPVESLTTIDGLTVAANYQNYNPATSTYVTLPAQNFTLRNVGKTNFAGAYYNTSNYLIIKDSDYKETGRVVSYNSLGLATETEVKKGRKDKVTYDTATKLLPLSTTANFGKTDAQTASNEYTKVFEGVSKQTSPNGLEARYVYENGTGRLLETRDKDNQLTGKWTYLLRTTSSSSSRVGLSWGILESNCNDSLSNCDFQISVLGLSPDQNAEFSIDGINWQKANKGTNGYLLSLPTTINAPKKIWARSGTDRQIQGEISRELSDDNFKIITP